MRRSSISVAERAELQEHLQVAGFLLTGLPREIGAAAAALEVPQPAFGPVRDGTWQAEFEVPVRSSWRVWPERGAALWIGRESRAPYPTRVPADARSEPLDLSLVLTRLAEHNLWLQEARVRADDSWGHSLPAAIAVGVASDASANIDAISGIWGDADGRVVRAVLYEFGGIRAHTEGQAERWLFIAHGLTDD